MLKKCLYFTATMSAMMATSQAQAGENPCPCGTRDAVIRDMVILPGEWATFEDAVAADNAWYASHGNDSRVSIVRIIPEEVGVPSTQERVVTVTIHADGWDEISRDEGFSAFVAKYIQSTELTSQANVCLPSLP